MKIIQYTTLAITLFLSSAANAELIQGDWVSNNDNNVALDTNTGLEWLNLTLTTGQSYNEVTRKIEAQSFSGFRFATETEVKAMFLNFTNLTEKTTNGAPFYKEFYSFFGNKNNQHMKFSYGLTERDDGTIAQYGVTDAATLYYDYNSYDKNYENKYYGFFLVSEGGATLSSQLDLNYSNAQQAGLSNVNGGGALLGLSLLGVAGVRRKYNKK